MDSTPSPSNTTPSIPITRQESLDELDKIIEETPKRFPGQVINFELWKTSINLKFDLKETLDAETYEIVNNHVLSARDPGLSQDQINARLDKARDCLSSHEELLRQFNEVHQLLTPQIVAQARDSVQRQENLKALGG